MILRIENSFDGVLSGVAWCLRSKTEPGAIISYGDCPLIIDCINIKTENNITDKHLRYLSRFIGLQEAHKVIFDLRCAWLSEQKGIEMAILHYIQLVVQMRLNPSDCKDIENAGIIITAAEKSRRLAHHHKGIIRFRKKTQRDIDVYIADIEPQCNILPLIADHFADRFNDQNFIIRDLKRNNAVCHEAADGRTYFIELGSDNSGLALSEEGVSYDDKDQAWTKYLEHLAIPQRINKKLQRNNLPFTSRKHMTEFKIADDPLNKSSSN